MCGSQLDATTGPESASAGSDPFEHFFRPRGGPDAASGQGEVLSASEIEELGSTHIAVNAAQAGGFGMPAGGDDAAWAGAVAAPSAQRRPEAGLGLILGREGVTTTASMPAIDAETTSVIPMPYAVVPPPGGHGGGGTDQRVPARRSPWFWVAVVAVPALVIAVFGWALSAGDTTPAAASRPVSPAPTTGASTAPTEAPSPTPTPSSTPDGFGPLRTGSQGALVRQVQDRLNDLGLYDGSSDGDFGGDTAQAVISFQAQAGVVGDPSGVVGPHTLEALTAAGSTPTVGDGDRAKTRDVRRLQGALALALDTPLARTGRYDAATVRAVRLYQQSRQLTDDTFGVVDDQTWAALQRGV